MRHLFFSIVFFVIFIACSKVEDTQDIDVEFNFEMIKWELVWEDNFITDDLPDGNIWVEYRKVIWYLMF
ncbi:MAG: hypothetical protein KAH68_02265 [Draconibacterium sp.]|nr:hypothetical protein [Draconibacterium sp.]